MSTKEILVRIYEEIAHGDEEHRAWLKAKLNNLADWLAAEHYEMYRSGYKVGDARAREEH